MFAHHRVVLTVWPIKNTPSWSNFWDMSLTVISVNVHSMMNINAPAKIRNYVDLT